ncbi:RDD family protein [Microtetraspora niveoalba]|uniref:RDD family protein n=1 Tax=Microtetraspora niveoalba TaxID=46175 RepID=UPI00083244A3|nr:RDD family protein [Microtetraspora niveoalba]
MTAEPPPGQNPYGSAPPPPPPGSYPPPGPYGGPQGAYGAPQGAPLPPGVPAPLAEWWERLVARIIDTLVFGVAYLILSAVFVFGTGGSFLGGFLSALIAYGLYTAYDYVLHSKDGQTVGKKIMKIRVVALGGAPLDSSVVMRRSAVYPGVLVLYGIPVLGLLASLFALVTGVFILVDKPLGQGLHDKVAGTVVVKTPR